MTRVEIRRCRSSDLRRLEWSDELRDDRSLVEWVYERASAGELTMLVAVVGPDPIGQIWIDYQRKSEIAVLWALRIVPSWRRRGIATRLVRAAEDEALMAGAWVTELGVERDNEAARTLYFALGYRSVGWEIARDAITGRALDFEIELMRRVLARDRRR